jgi:hypothetical protein
MHPKDAGRSLRYYIRAIVARISESVKCWSISSPAIPDMISSMSVWEWGGPVLNERFHSREFRAVVIRAEFQGFNGQITFDGRDAKTVGFDRFLNARQLRKIESGIARRAVMSVTLHCAERQRFSDDNGVRTEVSLMGSQTYCGGRASMINHIMSRPSHPSFTVLKFLVTPGRFLAGPVVMV